MNAGEKLVEGGSIHPLPRKKKNWSAMAAQQYVSRQWRLNEHRNEGEQM